jgi:hypothetical protein
MYLVGANFTLELLFANLKKIQVLLSIVLSIPTIYHFNSFKIIYKLYSHIFLIAIIVPLFPKF